MNNKKIILISISVLIIICGILVTFLITNKERPVKTTEEFGKIFRDAGYEIIDAIGMVDSNTGKEAKVAKKDDIIVQFFVLTSEDKAIELYAKYEKEFKSDKGEDGKAKISDGKNYQRYEQTANGKYSLASQVEDTFVYVNMADNQKAEVTKLIKELGY